jgi:DNA-binding MarR family transcriptional regulator
MDIVAKGGIDMQDSGFDRFYSTLCCTLKSVQKLKAKYMSPYGLSSSHTMCLRHLYAAPEGLTRTRLAKLCDIDKAQISRIVSELCSKGYITEPDSENINYRKRLKLTALGKDTAEDINRTVCQIQSFVSGDIPEEQLANFYSTLDLISDKLKQAENNS